MPLMKNMQLLDLTSLKTNSFSKLVFTTTKSVVVDSGLFILKARYSSHGLGYAASTAGEAGVVNGFRFKAKRSSVDQFSLIFQSFGSGVVIGQPLKSVPLIRVKSAIGSLIVVSTLIFPLVRFKSSIITEKVPDL